MVERMAFVLGVALRLTSFAATAWGFVEYEAAFPGPVAAILIARAIL